MSEVASYKIGEKSAPDGKDKSLTSWMYKEHLQMNKKNTGKPN